METEIAKLNKSQRNAMRAIVSTPLTKLSVQPIGWKVRESLGFCYRVDLGPRGAILANQL